MKSIMIVLILFCSLFNIYVFFDSYVLKKDFNLHFPNEFHKFYGYMPKKDLDRCVIEYTKNYSESQREFTYTKKLEDGIIEIMFSVVNSMYIFKKFNLEDAPSEEVISDIDVLFKSYLDSEKDFWFTIY